MSITRSRHVILSCALLALCAPARAGVIVVDPAGGGDFTQLQAAVDAAAPGDILLVALPGWPAGLQPAPTCVIDGKPLTIVCDQTSGPTVKARIGALTVKNLAAGQTVVLRGLWATAGAPDAHGLSVLDCAGAVWVEGCTLSGRGGVSEWGCDCGELLSVPGEAGLRVSDAASVTVIRSFIGGGNGQIGVDTGACAFFPPSPGLLLPSDAGTAAVVDDAEVAFITCELAGGVNVGPVVCGQAGDAGHGLVATDASILLSGCDVYAGESGFGANGDGVRANGAATVEVLDTAVIFGPGGMDYDVPPGALSSYPGADRSLVINPSPLREGQAGTLAMKGVQGDFVAFFWSLGGGSLSMPLRNGWFLLGPPFIAGPFLIGFISAANGVWDLPIMAPALPSAAQGQNFLLQPWFKSPSGVTLGSGAQLLLLDAAL